MKRAAIALVSVGMGLGLASGCGPSADTPAAPSTTVPTTAAPTSTAPAITKAEFLVRANAVCADGNEQIAAITKSLPGGKPATFTELATWMHSNSQIVGGTVTKLRALPQPPADAAELAAMYAEADQLVALSDKMAVAAEQGNQAEVTRISDEGDVLQPKANARLTAYGLTECGKS